MVLAAPDGVILIVANQGLAILAGCGYVIIFFFFDCRPPIYNSCSPHCAQQHEKHPGLWTELPFRNSCADCCNLDSCHNVAAVRDCWTSSGCQILSDDVLCTNTRTPRTSKISVECIAYSFDRTVREPRVKTCSADLEAMGTATEIRWKLEVMFTCAETKHTEAKRHTFVEAAV